MSNSKTSYDVVIVGGGPVGSTVSTLLRRYDPSLSVVVLEKAKFPRDHVGESQLPGVGAVLDEMGCWDKVEAAGFPVKIGASLTWGHTTEPWDLDFYPSEQWQDEPRPARYEGQRRQTAFQVDRAIYDDILLRHAESLGAEVREETRVTEVLQSDDGIDGLVLDNGETVTGRHYVDGSGAWGVLRKALGVEVDAPHELRNIAIYDYWENAKWAVEIGVGATRVQIRSLPYGWIWFIPLGPTRTSIGLICPAEYYRKSGKTPEELYEQALADEKNVARLIEDGTRRGTIETCKDWSHLAARLAGRNWFLAGEAAGFADPILAAGMTLAHASARDVAYTILELERGEHPADWLRSRFDERNRTNIQQHIRFAQYWYSANGCFSDLQENCTAIAKEAGLRLSPQQAWRWLSWGGFTHQNLELPSTGSFELSATKQLVGWFDESGREAEWSFEGYNVFRLNVHNATEGWLGRLEHGRVQRVPCLMRGEATLPLYGYYGTLVEVLKQTEDAQEIFQALEKEVARSVPPEEVPVIIDRFFQILDALIHEGWILRKKNKKRPVLHRRASGQMLRTAADGAEATRAAGVSFKSPINEPDQA